ncbi:trypsin-like serine protease [Deinococcus sp.]|uniref:trypsin-like serine protease n=1 Tax=Deinococcus sp. TaxID=47478 RepID=UPI00345C25EF
MSGSGTSSILLYPGRSTSSDAYDIALIKVSSPFTLGSTVQPAALPSNTVEAIVDVNGRSATVSGWGETETGASSPTALREVTIPITPTGSDCGSRPGNTICGRYASGKDSCNGDSYGPAACRGYGVYTRVNGYINWIYQRTGGPASPRSKPEPRHSSAQRTRGFPARVRCSLPGCPPRIRENGGVPSSVPLTSHAQATAHLSLDPVLAEVIARVGELPVLTPTPDPFGMLIRSVTGQQLSVKAAASIHARLSTELGEISADTLLAASGDTLRGAGLSWAKVRTVQAAAQAARSGAVDFAHLATQDDEDVIAALLPLPGIGRWTAEMFLMFALARPDVFSLGDLALRQGLSRLHPHEPPAEVLLRWSPYRTLAARYVWADNARVKAGGQPV